LIISGEADGYFHANGLDLESLAGQGPVIPGVYDFDLDDLPYPAWDLVLELYQPKLAFVAKGTTLPIQATRGCPYSCFHYCTYPAQQGRKVRQRSPAKVIEEMRHWQDMLGVTSFIFRDPVFSLNRKHTEQLCDALEAIGAPFTFGVETHLKNLEAGLGERLYNVGLRLVYVGIESVTPEVIADAHRATIPIDQQSERITALEALGIKVKTMFIFGFPKDDFASIRRSIEYALKLRTSYAQFSVFTPYPGTPVFREYASKIATPQFEDFTQWNLVFDHPILKPKDIRSLLNQAYRRYYTNPPWLLKTALASLKA
ncbi:MAG: B12-binding domain-containing radical SAM protein, partial [Rhodospirillales bacterium]